MSVLIVAATNSEITSPNTVKNSILITGLGMVNTAINLSKKLMCNKYDLVINMGIAGSFSDELNNGDVVEVVEDNFSELGFEDNLDFSRFIDQSLKTKYMVKAKTNLRKVRGVTVNTVHGSNKSIDKIVKRLNPEIESMEGAAVFQVCEEFNVSCIQVRSISNKVERRNKDNWDLDLAIKNLNIEVEKIIDNL